MTRISLVVGLVVASMLLGACKTAKAPAGARGIDMRGVAAKSLADYSVQYYDALPQDTADVADTDGEYEVVSFSPSGELPADIDKPSFTILFSKPTAPLAGLGAPIKSLPYITVAPPIVDGTFRWYGGSTLSFESSSPLIPQTQYSVTIGSKLHSLSGRKLTGNRVFSFTTEAVKLIALEPGYGYKSDAPRAFGINDVPIAAAKTIGVRFNYAVPVSAKKYISATSAGRKYTFAATAVKDDPTVMLLSFSQAFPENATVAITLEKGFKTNGAGAPSVEQSSLSFNTVKPFSLVDAVTDADGALVLRFSHSVNKDRVLAGVSLSPALKLSADDIEVADRAVKINVGDALRAGERLTVTVGTALVDVDGRPLASAVTETVLGMARSASFVAPGSGPVMAEATYGYQPVVATLNMKEGAYSLTTPGNPLADSEAAMSTVMDLSRDSQDKLVSHTVNVTNLLSSAGKGWIALKMRLKGDVINYDGKPESREFILSSGVQVTDLAATVRYASNRAVVLVTKLSTGAPVAGAKVSLLRLSYDSKERASVSNAALDVTGMRSEASGLSDAAGLAALSLTPAEFIAKFSYPGSPHILVETRDDKIFFSPRDHNAWASGINNVMDPASPGDADGGAYLVSNGDLFRPGGTVSFKGIDETRDKNDYKPYRGGYVVQLMEDAYRGETLLTIRGVTSATGTFWGTITLPDSIKTGYYRLRYSRNDVSNQEMGSLSIRVDAFDRDAFNVNASVARSDYLAGDVVTAKIDASYYGSGPLVGAAYRAVWFKGASYFTPPDPALYRYSFGPQSFYDAERVVSESSGALDDDGLGGGVLTGTKSTVAGVPYQYTLEARVTDKSTKTVSGKRYFTVHPAAFYVGIKNDSPNYAQKVGTAIPLSYRIIDSLGVKTNRDLPTSLKIEILRQDRRVVVERGVAGKTIERFTDIYTPISSQTRSIKGDTGSFEVIAPAKPGYYVARVSATDRASRTAVSEMGLDVSGPKDIVTSAYVPGSAPLELKSDKVSYNIGDTVKVYLKNAPSATGAFLATVEREGIFSQITTRPAADGLLFSFPVEKRHYPQIYVAVAGYSVRTGAPSSAPGKPDLDRPKSLFGALAIDVKDPDKELTLSILGVQKSYKPGETVSATLKATNSAGKAISGAELTLVALDDGVTALTAYKPIDPLAFFYGPDKFPLRASGGDSRAMLMRPIAAYDRANLMGGDGASKVGSDKRMDFNSTAAFIPVLTTDASGSVQARFKLPDTLTSYTIYALGADGDARFGSAAPIKIEAVNPINVREVLPRALRVRDTANVGVIIENTTDRARSVTTTLSIDATTARIDGAPTGVVDVAPGQSAYLRFRVAALGAGPVKLSFATSVPGLFRETLIKELTISDPKPVESFTISGRVSSTSPVSEGIILPKDDYGPSTLNLTLSGSPVGSLKPMVESALNAPSYGNSMDDSLSRYEIGRAFGQKLSEWGIKAPKPNFREWAAAQHADGGFGYSFSSSDSDYYVSLRMVEALNAARRAGDATGVNAAGLYAYLRAETSKEKSLYLKARAWAALAAAKEAPANGVREALWSDSDRNQSVTALLGLAALDAGDARAAETAVNEIKAYLTPTTQGVDYKRPNAAKKPGSYFDRDDERYATALMLLSKADPDADLTRKLAAAAVMRIRGSQYLANMRLALALAATPEAMVDVENRPVSAFIKEVKFFEGAVTGSSFAQTFALASEPFAKLAKNVLTSLSLSAKSAASIYYAVTLRYPLPSEIIPARDEGLGVFSQYIDLDTGAPASPSALVEGKIYRVETVVSSTSDRYFVDVTVPIPSGAAIVDGSFATGSSYSEKAGERRADDDQESDSLEFYDTMARFSYRRLNAGVGKASFLIRAAAAGIYPTPPVTAECVYENEVFGRDAGKLVVVKSR